MDDEERINEELRKIAFDGEEKTADRLHAMKSLKDNIDKKAISDRYGRFDRAIKMLEEAIELAKSEKIDGKSVDF